MRIERGISRTNKRIRSRVPSNLEVATRVDAIQRLHILVEQPQAITGLVEQPNQICRLGLVRPIQVEVSAQAAWIVREAVVSINGLIGYRTQVHRVVHEWSGLNAAAAGPGWVQVADTEGRHVARAVGDVLAVAAKRCHGAVEYRRLPRGIVEECPVPIGLRASIAAFIAQGLLVEPREVAMEEEEYALDEELVKNEATRAGWGLRAHREVDNV